VWGRGELDVLGRDPECRVHHHLPNNRRHHARWQGSALLLVALFVRLCVLRPGRRAKSFVKPHADNSIPNFGGEAAAFDRSRAFVALLVALVVILTMT
jgi:hypothetical protein